MAARFLMDLMFNFQCVGLPKCSSTEIRNQDVHTNGPVLDDIILSDPEVATVSEFLFFKTWELFFYETCFLLK